MATFPRRQGQLPAFIPLCRLLHKQGTAEAYLVSHSRVTPPSAHGMVVKLEAPG